MSKKKSKSIKPLEKGDPLTKTAHHPPAGTDDGSRSSTDEKDSLRRSQDPEAQDVDVDSLINPSSISFDDLEVSTAPSTTVQSLAKADDRGRSSTDERDSLRRSQDPEAQDVDVDSLINPSFDDLEVSTAPSTTVQSLAKTDDHSRSSTDERDSLRRSQDPEAEDDDIVSLIDISFDDPEASTAPSTTVPEAEDDEIDSLIDPFSISFDDLDIAPSTTIPEAEDDDVVSFIDPSSISFDDLEASTAPSTAAQSLAETDSTSAKKFVGKVEEVDPFLYEDPLAETADVGSTLDHIHIRVQQRNGRKTLTILQGLPKKKYKEKKILQAFKKDFACNGTLFDDKKMGRIIQLQGDHRKEILKFLTEGGIPKETIMVHGF